MQADFFAEEVRRNLLAAYGEKGLYEGGLTVSTTLDPAIQAIADKALREGLIAYDRRHGWRGPYAKIADMSGAGRRSSPASPSAGRSSARRAGSSPSSPRSIRSRSASPACPTTAPMQATVRHRHREGTVPFAEMPWARPTLPDQRSAARRAAPPTS